MVNANTAALLGQARKQHTRINQQRTVDIRELSQHRLDERKCALLNKKENWAYLNESK